MEKIMDFNSKTALAEHIRRLVKDGYLNEHWDIQHIQGGTKRIKYYTINFDTVEK